MKLQFILIIITINLILLTGKILDSTTITGKVISCHDGDTCKIEIAKHIQLSARLACIDAPELNQKKNPFAKAAQLYLNKTLKNKEIKLTQVDSDKYARPIVYIIHKDTNINHLLLKKGFAEVYKGKTSYSKEICLNSEWIAKKKKFGIWSLKNYQSPSIFRKRHKAHGNKLKIIE